MHTTDDPFSKLPVTTGALVPPSKKPDAASVPSANSLGWTVVDRRGQRTLARQHPITIEGQEIGTFEIAFTCSEKSDAYRVLYQERRLVQNSPSIPTDRLEVVGILIRQDNTSMRSLLTLEESIPGKSPTELLSRARGTVSASFLETVVTSSSGDTIAASNQQGIVVATSTVEKVRTLIRVGHTGFPEGLRLLASSCDDGFPR